MRLPGVYDLEFRLLGALPLGIWPDLGQNYLLYESIEPTPHGYFEAGLFVFDDLTYAVAELGLYDRKDVRLPRIHPALEEPCWYLGYSITRKSGVLLTESGITFTNTIQLYHIAGKVLISDFFTRDFGDQYRTFGEDEPLDTVF